ncbi:MAG: methyltransferase domain-containing protein [Desulfobacterales bacterium]|uniref:Methyltransferase domain-containing protein n=1 Tax=Candidatus Desulfatibia vada TaxID=2841696 RepID=A0A8J6NRZ5_9BACT|nr:methyltransferase domain-containing protein [Candidatus Desulfatibia vada]MBL6970946.1 methyltransferase domain-containing protein [Desulfobacterales bacterium]
MKRIHQDAIADILFKIKWESDQAFHTENYQADNINFWRDCLPELLYGDLEGKSIEASAIVDFGPGSLVAEHDSRQTFEIKDDQFNRRFFADESIEPRMGRFYPKGLLKGIAGVFPQNLQPFRYVGARNGRLKVDFNHPLAKHNLQLTAIVKNIKEKASERGGRYRYWVDTITSGPGMQSRWENRPTDFLSKDAFQRDDEHPDRLFYQKPRLVQHLDDTAVEVVKTLYGRFIKDGMQVLDLMSSWKSHMPFGVHLKKLSGLGLNAKELNNNKDLSERILHDANKNPSLPFETASYDVVVCTVSVEYLIHPKAVFQEVGRILRPDGVFAVTFSNRWFPAKAIKVWKELHEFERVGLVMEYFNNSDCFKNLETFSMRNLPRPQHDKHYSEIDHSDPIFAVWGHKI